jgi:hypothetical protein
MKSKVSIVCILSVIIFFGCSMLESKRIISGAKRFLKKEFIPRLHDPNSYVLEELTYSHYTTKGELISVIEDNFKKELEKWEKNTSSLIARKKALSDEKMENIFKSARSSSSTRSYLHRRNNEIEREIRELDRQINRFENPVGNYLTVRTKVDIWAEDYEDDEILYHLIIHTYRAKNRFGGYVRDYNQILYFPKKSQYIIDSCPILNVLMKLQEELIKLQELEEYYRSRSR